jgi:hypothetical protein
MFAPVGRFFKFVGKVISSTYIFICNASWVIFIVWFILLAPAAFELERGQIEGIICDKKKSQRLTSSDYQCECPVNVK